MSDPVLDVVVPQLDVNDLEMELVDWSVDEGARVEVGAELCTLETAKATHTLVAERAGVVARLVGGHVTVRVGDVIARIGASVEALAAAPASDSGSGSSESSGPREELRVTAKAQTLIDAHGLDVADIPRAGALLKEKDVRRYLDEQRGGAGETRVPEELARHARLTGPRSRAEVAAADALAAAREGALEATAELDVLLGRGAAPEASLLASRVLVAVGGALSEHPRFKSVLVGESLLEYDATDVALTVAPEGPAGRLVAPVLRGLDRVRTEELVPKVARLLDGSSAELADDALTGACFTVTLAPAGGAERFRALVAPHQSAALAVGAPRSVLDADSRTTVVGLTLTYDHRLATVFAAGAFLASIRERLVARPA